MANPWDNDPVLDTKVSVMPWMNDPVVTGKSKSLAVPTNTEIPNTPKTDTSGSTIDKFVGGLKSGIDSQVAFAAGLGKGVGTVALNAQNYAGKGLSALGADKYGQWLQSDANKGLNNLSNQVAPYKADSPIAAGAGELGGEVAATLPVGGALGKIVGGVAKAIPAAQPVLTPLANSLSSSGFTTGATQGTLQNIATRVAGGAATGGASAALVNPDNTGTGAIIGGLLPPSIKALGVAGSGVADAWRNMISHGDRAGAQSLEKALMIGSPSDRQAIIDRLNSAPTLVQGASPTVAQALQTPEAGILNRVIYDSPGGAPLRNKISAQNDARNAAVESVAPTGATGYRDAQNDLGNAIISRVVPEQKAISQNISSMYNAIDPTGTEKIPLPIGQMKNSVNRYMGTGSFGDNTDPISAINAAKSVGNSKPANTLMNIPAQGPTANWRQALNLRSSLNDAISKATISGDKQAAGTLSAQKSALDDAIQKNLSPEALSAFNEANASHAAKMDRFYNGPQAGIFKTGQNGTPALQGGEVTSKFWNQSPGAAADVQAFRKLVDDNPDMLGRFKSLITTQGAGTADASGNLTTKFSKWVDQSLPGMREAFSPSEVQTLQNVAADIDRNAAANKAGTSLGGSNTYQNASNALNLGVLDSPIVSKAASMIPGLKYIAGPALEGLKGTARNAKANQLAGLLSNSQDAAKALETYGSGTGIDSSQVANLKRLLSLTAAKTLPVAASR